MKRTIGTVIIKPTRDCNADCSYCCAPPDGAPRWDIKTFIRVFDALEPRLSPRAVLIWHGGEPMLQGPAFYRAAFDHARSRLPGIRFSLQSNMLAYGPKWRDVFGCVFNGSVSTSWDPDKTCRTMNGDSALYARVFASRLDRILEDGWRPTVISTFDEASAGLAHDVYEQAMGRASRGHPHDIRLNYRYPAGRASRSGPAILPATYGRMLLEIYDRWITDCPDFLVTPLDQMLRKVAGAEAARCPWTRNCTGRIVGLEPNFDLYNCAEFADLGMTEYRFGNLLADGIDACLSSPAARALAMRRLRHPEDCRSCPHFAACEGACMRDSLLFDHGLYGKFQYCESWQIVFSRIKSSIIAGEADRILDRLGQDADFVRRTVLDGLAGFAAGMPKSFREPPEMAQASFGGTSGRSS